MDSTKIERLKELQTKFASKSGLAYIWAKENIDVLLNGNIHDVINWHYNQSWFQRYSHHYPRLPLTPEEWEIENARWHRRYREELARQPYVAQWYWRSAKVHALREEKRRNRRHNAISNRNNRNNRNK